MLLTNIKSTRTLQMVLRSIRSHVVSAHQILVPIARRFFDHPLDLQHFLARTLRGTAANAADFLPSATWRTGAKRLERIRIGDIVLRANRVLLVRKDLLGACLALQIATENLAHFVQGAASFVQDLEFCACAGMQNINIIK